MKVSFQTLGCRLNQYESDSLAAQFAAEGWEIRDFGEEVDVCVVNTCTVTNRADRKSRNTIGKAEKTRGSLVVVTGCFAENARSELEGRGGVDYVVDNSRKSAIPGLVAAHFRGELPRAETLDTGVFAFTPAQDIYHTRAAVKIQDGCDNFCTYCIIPFVRGPGTSRPLEEIETHVNHLVQSGFKEIILTGVNITRYHHQGLVFEDLLERILEIPGDWRLRLGSVEPENLGERFLALLNHPRLCPSLHLCLQSGSAMILKAMARSYTLEEYGSLVARIKELRPDYSLTTDMITGFPGETDQDHRDSLMALKTFGYAQVHVFPYSLRTGTKAASMESQPLPKVLDHRTEEMDLAARDLTKTYRLAWLGRTQRVLVERVKGSRAFGHTEHYLPVEFDLDGVNRNDFVQVRVESLGPAPEFVLNASPLKPWTTGISAPA